MYNNWFNPNKDYYQILWVNQNATKKEIEKAFRKLAMKYHPDKAPAGKKKEYGEKFKEINEAREVLTNDELKKEYDYYLKNKEEFWLIDEFESYLEDWNIYKAKNILIKILNQNFTELEKKKFFFVFLKFFYDKLLEELELENYSILKYYDDVYNILSKYFPYIEWKLLQFNIYKFLSLELIDYGIDTFVSDNFWQDQDVDKAIFILMARIKFFTIVFDKKINWNLKKWNDITLNLKISLDDLLKGWRKKIKYFRYKWNKLIEEIIYVNLPKNSYDWYEMKLEWKWHDNYNNWNSWDLYMKFVVNDEKNYTNDNIIKEIMEIDNIFNIVIVIIIIIIFFIFMFWWPDGLMALPIVLLVLLWLYKLKKRYFFDYNYVRYIIFWLMFVLVLFMVIKLWFLVTIKSLFIVLFVIWLIIYLTESEGLWILIYLLFIIGIHFGSNFLLEDKDINYNNNVGIETESKQFFNNIDISRDDLIDVSHMIYLTIQLTWLNVVEILNHNFIKYKLTDNLIKRIVEEGSKKFNNYYDIINYKNLKSVYITYNDSVLNVIVVKYLDTDIKSIISQIWINEFLLKAKEDSENRWLKDVNDYYKNIFWVDTYILDYKSNKYYIKSLSFLVKSGNDTYEYLLQFINTDKNLLEKDFKTFLNSIKRIDDGDPDLNNRLISDDIKFDITDILKRNNSKCWENKCYFKWKCWNLPSNAHCVENDEYNAWKCNNGYYEKNNYCWCKSWKYSCNDYSYELLCSSDDTKIKELKNKIDNYHVNRYSKKSVNYYNSLVSRYNNLIYKRNKCLNDNCICKP